MLAWFGNILILVSIWRLGNKHRDGWLFSVFGNFCWAVFGVQVGILSITTLDALMMLLAIRNWNKWA